MIESVSFFANGELISNPLTEAPYHTTWTPLNAGLYNLYAMALDNQGNIAISDVHSFICVAPDYIATFFTPYR